MRSYYVYLLGSLKTSNSKASYIGFSTDPEHRLRQHNNEVGGGARHTSKYRPWHHITIMSGFPNKIVALMFEWQWQHADRSRILKSKMKESRSAYSGPLGKLRILLTILQQPIWAQMGLKANFQEYTAFEFFKSLIEKEKTKNVGDTNIVQALTSVQYEFVTINDINDMVTEANATSSKWASGNDTICSECDDEIDNDNNKLMWYCSKCSRIAHVECTAKKADRNVHKDALFPDRFSCHACKVEHTRADLSKTSFYLHEIAKAGSKRKDALNEKQKKSKSAKKANQDEATGASTCDDGFYSELGPEDFVILDDDQDTRDTAFSIGSKDDGFMAGFSQGTCSQPDIDEKGKGGGSILDIIEENCIIGATQLDDDDDDGDDDDFET